MSRIATGLRNLRRHPEVLKDIAAGARKLCKDLPNWWLEGVFGWKPLVSDIKGALDDLSLIGTGQHRVTAKGKAKIIVFEGEQPIWAGTPNNETVRARVVHKSFTRIDAAPIAGSLITAAQCGITNPLSLAWELLPWSFAIDWLVPVGQYIDNLDAPLGWEILGMSTSDKTEVSMSRKGLNYEDFFTRQDRNYTARYRYTSLNRSSAQVMPWEIVPRIKDPFSSAERVNTQLSLLLQLLGRGKYSHLH
jgi:hypothetical protein